jgi:hypothetical protein
MKAGHMLENRNFVSMLGCVYGSESILYILSKYWFHHMVGHFFISDSKIASLYLSIYLSIYLLI